MEACNWADLEPLDGPPTVRQGKTPGVSPDILLNQWVEGEAQAPPADRPSACWAGQLRVKRRILHGGRHTRVRACLAQGHNWQS